MEKPVSDIIKEVAMKAGKISLRLLIVCIVGVFILTLPQSSSANPDIPEDNLAYPVLLKWENGSGSGFFYNKDDATYLITARHVLFKPTTVLIPSQIAIPKSLKPKLFVSENKQRKAFDLVFYGTLMPEEKIELIKALPNQDRDTFTIAIEELYSKSQEPKLNAGKIVLRSSAPSRLGGGVNEIELDMVKLFSDKHIRYHPTRDVAYIKIGLPRRENEQEQLTLVDGVRKRQAAGIIGIAEAHVKLLKDINVGSQAVVFGYPTTITEVDPWLSIDLPLLRKGIVAGINKDLDAIILDCSVFGGNSGGLALVIEGTSITGFKYSAIGVVTNFVPYNKEWFQNSGYSIVVPMDFVEELFKPGKTSIDPATH